MVTQEDIVRSGVGHTIANIAACSSSSTVVDDTDFHGTYIAFHFSSLSSYLTSVSVDIRVIEE
jgi:hypothetical protein